MEYEKIMLIISDYNTLLHLTNTTIKTLKMLDNQYYWVHWVRGTPNISFDANNVVVDDSDSILFSFPIVWLTKSVSELEEIVKSQKRQREERDRQKREEDERRSKQHEFREYQRLKAKFENNTNE